MSDHDWIEQSQNQVWRTICGGFFDESVMFYRNICIWKVWRCPVVNRVLLNVNPGLMTSHPRIFNTSFKNTYLTSFSFPSPPCPVCDVLLKATQFTFVLFHIREQHLLLFSLYKWIFSVFCTYSTDNLHLFPLFYSLRPSVFLLGHPVRRNPTVSFDIAVLIRSSILLCTSFLIPNSENKRNQTRFKKTSSWQFSCLFLYQYWLHDVGILHYMRKSV